MPDRRPDHRPGVRVIEHPEAVEHGGTDPHGVLTDATGEGDGVDAPERDGIRPDVLAQPVDHHAERQLSVRVTGGAALLELTQV